MTAIRPFASAVTLLFLCACFFPDRALEVRTITLDHLTAAQAMDLATPYLSKQGSVFHSKELLNTITVRDRARNVQRVSDMLRTRDASPANVTLRFQLIRATEAGEVGAGLERLANALGELLRFRGYQLMSEAVVSAAERGTVEQSLDIGGMPLQLGVDVRDVRRSGGSGSVELEVELRRPGGRLLMTNVVVPVGQTVVLGSASPGADGSALILTVQGEMGTQSLRASRTRRSGTDEAYMRDDHLVGAATGVVHVEVQPATTKAVQVTHIVVPTPRGAAVGAEAARASGMDTRTTKAPIAPRTRPPIPPPAH
jgi:hypothetical protein